MPRPVVLTGPAINDPASGFARGDDKDAYASGRFKLATTLPSGTPKPDGHRLMTAAQAYAALTSQLGGRPSGTALRVSRVAPAASTFSTDRGARVLPAWAFTFAGVADPAYVLAIATTDRWPRGDQPSAAGGSQQSVTVSPNQKTLTVTFVGSPAGSGPCDAQYAIDTAEAATAVWVKVQQLPNNSPAPSPTLMGNPPTLTVMTCDLMGYPRTATATLSSPLGNRVIVDEYGAAIPAS
jgi:hypothetical protein